MSTVKNQSKRKSKKVLKTEMTLLDAVKQLTAASNNLNAQVNGLRLATLRIVKNMDAGL